MNKGGNEYIDSVQLKFGRRYFYEKLIFTHLFIFAVNTYKDLSDLFEN